MTTRRATCMSVARSLLLLALATLPLHAAEYESDHFRITYDPARIADQSHGLIDFSLPPGWDANTLEAAAPGFMNEPNFIRCLACWLEYGYQTYESDGFRVPADRVPVWVMDLGGSKLGMVVPPLLDWFFLDPGWYTHPVPTQMTMFIHEAQGNTTLRSTAVHELTHVVQLQYWGLYNLSYPAFVEGPAVATENTIIARPVWYWAFCENVNHQQPDAGPGFLTMNADAWSWAYSTGIIWTYLMEHNGDPSLRYPGIDLLRELYEATASDPFIAPTEAVLFDSLHALLSRHGTTLTDEMRDFAFCNLIRLYDNLGGDHAWGLWWDDDSSFFDYEDSDWHIAGVDACPDDREATTIHLNELSDAARLSSPVGGVYESQEPNNVIRDAYGCQYWQYPDDPKTLIEDAGGLAYDGPGLPWRVEAAVEEPGSNPSLLMATGFRDTSAIFHESGVIRFDDDRVEAAAVAVTDTQYADHYKYTQTATAYEPSSPSHGPIGGLAFEHTYRLPLAPHEILMRGITNAFDYHRADVISVLACATNSGLEVEPSAFACPQPDFAYSSEDLFQMNLRRYSEGTRTPGYYLNNEQAMVTPADRNEMTNSYIQNTIGDGYYRLDLRQDPAQGCSTGLLLTLFPYSILDSLKPDLLVRDWLFSLDSTGRLTGRFAILNQGTAAAGNVRIPVFVTAMAWGPLHKGQGRTASWDTTLVIDTTLSFLAGYTGVIEVDCQTNWDWQDEIAREPSSRMLTVWVEMGVNSAAGATGPGAPGMPPRPRDELTMQNNGPERAAVYCFFSPAADPLFTTGDIAEMTSWFEDEQESLIALLQNDPRLGTFADDYCWNALERARALNVFASTRPWLLESPFRLDLRWRREVTDLDLHAVLRFAAGWAGLIGLGDHVPPAARPSPLTIRRAADADSAATAPDNPGLGDVNGDGLADAKDALLSLNILLGTVAASPLQLFSADVGNDARLGLTDIELQSVPERPTR